MKLKETKTGVSVVIKTRGGVRSIPTGCKTKKEAERVVKKANVKQLEETAKATKLTREVVSQLVSGKCITMPDAIEEWRLSMIDLGHPQERTIYNNVSFMRAWVRHQKLEKETPSAVSEKHINGWVNADDGAKLGTRTVRLSILRQFLDFCSNKGYCIGNPARVFRKVNMSKLSHKQKEKRTKVAFTEVEYEKLLLYIKRTITKLEEDLAKITAPNKEGTPLGKMIVERIESLKFWNIACVIGWSTGLRIGDVCQIEWDCISTPGKIAVWTDKRDKRVELELTPDLAEVIFSVEWKHERFMFPTYHSLINSEKRAQVSSQFARICERCGLRGHTFHDFRYAYIQNCEAAGIPMPHIAERVGHSSTSTTSGYSAKAEEPAEPPALAPAPLSPSPSEPASEAHPLA